MKCKSSNPKNSGENDRCIGNVMSGDQTAERPKYFPIIQTVAWAMKNIKQTAVISIYTTCIS